MGDCEICGRRPAIKKAVIEGVVFNVCGECAKLGKEIVEKTAVKSRAPRGGYHKSIEFDVVDDYSQILKRKISSLGIKYEDLARKINENESYLRRVVRGETYPTERIAKKLEKELGVKIIEEEE